MEALREKEERLKAFLAPLGSLAVAFSSGVDSTYLLKIAHDLLGERAVAVTVRSSVFPQREGEEAAAFCEREGISQIFIDLDPLSIPGFAENPKNRCYLCKRTLFARIQTAAAERGISHVAEGSNMDDLGDYRPGLAAVSELGILSPLREAELTKEEIRRLSREKGLPTWDKPSFACLASRFAYGETITREKLAMVEKAEEMLLRAGFCQARVRVHGALARIEVEPSDFPKLLDLSFRRELTRFLRGLGFLYVTLDLEGYQTGSMNRPLEKEP